MTETEEKVKGVIFALPENAIHNILECKKDVFVKYMPHEPSKKSKIRIKEGLTFYFYQSKSSNIVVGEAKIKSVDYFDAKSILNKFSSRLMLSKKEFQDYCANRIDKKALVLELSSIKKYRTPKRTKKYVTMGGQYVTNLNDKMIFEAK